jgi:hypothetical protein
MYQMIFENLTHDCPPPRLSQSDKAGETSPKRSENDLAGMCHECLMFTSKKCPGKTRAEVKPGEAPCRRYKIDYALLGISSNEPQITKEDL